MQLKNNQKGFTLVELMVTVVLLAIISAVAVPIYLGYKKEAQTQEAYLQLSQIADRCIGKIEKSLSTGSSTTSFTLIALVTGDYFNYDFTPTCTTTGGIFTATGIGGSVTGDTLTVTVAMTGTVASKTWGGDLF
jgi:prepilin-type N-terminal cleavage/methylation domain-containing protein